MKSREDRASNEAFRSVKHRLLGKTNDVTKLISFGVAEDAPERALLDSVFMCVRGCIL